MKSLSFKFTFHIRVRLMAKSCQLRNFSQRTFLKMRKFVYVDVWFFTFTLHLYEYVWLLFFFFKFPLNWEYLERNFLLGSLKKKKITIVHHGMSSLSNMYLQRNWPWQFLRNVAKPVRQNQNNNKKTCSYWNKKKIENKQLDLDVTF